MTEPSSNSLVAGYRDHLQSLDDWFEDVRINTASGIIPCARGCSACCNGPFDISPADAAMVREAVDQLPAGVALGIRRRAAEHRAMGSEAFEAWRAPWDVEALPELVFDELCEELADVPCPALDVDGSCLIHGSRPATCRITGLAMQLPTGEILDNVCPIQTDFPAYQMMAPSLFDLMAFETESDWWDEMAAAAGFVTTTVAGAVV